MLGSDASLEAHRLCGPWATFDTLPPEAKRTLSAAAEEFIDAKRSQDRETGCAEAEFYFLLAGYCSSGLQLLIEIAREHSIRLSVFGEKECQKLKEIATQYDTARVRQEPAGTALAEIERELHTVLLCLWRDYQNAA